MVSDGTDIEISIGVIFSPKEIQLEIRGDVQKLIAQIEGAIKAGEKVLTLPPDKEGKIVILPVDKIAYCDIHPELGGNSIGFG